MSERRFDPSDAAWRLLSAPAQPALRLPRADAGIVVLDESEAAIEVPPSAGVEAPYRAAPALGAAEVVVYADDDGATLGTVGRDRLELLVEVWADRYRELGDRPEINYVYVFDAPEAAISRPHTRVHGYPHIPPRAERKLERAQAHLDAHGTCLYCDIVAREQADGVRVVAENESFVGFVPFAPRHPGELHVLARRHAPSLNDLTDPERRSLAELLDRVVPAYEAVQRPRLPYAMAMYQAPTDDGRRQPISHLQLEFAPELGGGAFVVDVAPEDTAAELRGALAR